MGLSVRADLASELHDGESSEGPVPASLQLWAHSTAALITWLGNPSMLGHHQVCPTRLDCDENLCFKLNAFLLYLFPVTVRLYF